MSSGNVRLLTLVSLLVLAGGACRSRPGRVEAPPINPAQAGAAAIQKFDADGNGTINGDELLQTPALKATLERIDRNGDGEITATEIANRIEQWQESQLGRLGVSCTVTREDKPVAGATVAFVPEPFLAGQLQTATAVTNDDGVARLCYPGETNGVPPGLYRVEITKEGDDIPAKYNSQTVFGQEVSIEAEDDDMTFAID